MAMSTDEVRRANLSQILRLIHLDGPLSRARITASTGLNRSTVGTLVGELQRIGLVVEGPPQLTGGRGRPSPLVSVRTRCTVVLATDIKVDSIAVAAVGLGGDVVASVRQDRPRARTSVDTTVADLAGLAKDVLGRLDDDQRVVGMSVSVVGLVDADAGEVADGPNLGWTHAPLVADLLDAMGVDLPVTLRNDGDAGAWAEHQRGVAVGVDDLLYVSGEVGVGGGVLVAGAPLLGARQHAGEIGHMALDPSGPPCRCGSTGCLEVLVGENALLRESGRPEDGGQQAVDEVMAALARDEPQALAAVATVGHWLAVGLANLVNAFDPEMVVLGDLHARLHPWVVDIVQERFTRSSLVARRSPVDVVPALLGRDSSLLGGAELALEPLLGDPAGHGLGPVVGDLR